MIVCVDDELLLRFKLVVWCVLFVWFGYRILVGEEDCVNIFLVGLGFIIFFIYVLVFYWGNVYIDLNLLVCIFF